mmetsp:Transcript_25198/g.51803  ORF Transcript_25198/g.51803 Transcript_25198/m.51803 type:complete len:226 (-) Transcript_25198:165-842(-)
MLNWSFIPSTYTPFLSAAKEYCGFCRTWFTTMSTSDTPPAAGAPSSDFFASAEAAAPSSLAAASTVDRYSSLTNKLFSFEWNSISQLPFSFLSPKMRPRWPLNRANFPSAIPPRTTSLPTENALELRIFSRSAGDSSSLLLTCAKKLAAKLLGSLYSLSSSRTSSFTYSSCRWCEYKNWTVGYTRMVCFSPPREYVSANTGTAKGRLSAVLAKSVAVEPSFVCWK